MKQEDIEYLVAGINFAQNKYENEATPKITVIGWTLKNPETGNEYNFDDWVFIYFLKSDSSVTMFIGTKSRTGKPKWFCPSKSHIFNMMSALRFEYIELDKYNERNRHKISPPVIATQPTEVEQPKP